jgi:hypothetical protein
MTLERVAVIGFKNSQAGIEHFAPRHDHDVVAGRDFVSAKDLAYQSLRTVARNGPSKLSSDRNAQASDGALVRQREQRRVAPANPDALIINLLKLRSSSNPFVAPESGQPIQC